MYKPITTLLCLPFLIAFCISTGKSQYETDPNTVALWHFDEASGNVVRDTSSQGNHGTASGTTIVSGFFGLARNFNGVSTDYVEIPHSASLALNRTFTIEARINFEEGGTINPRIFSKGQTTGFELYTNGTGTTRRLGFDVVRDGTQRMNLQSRTIMNAGQWYHVAVTYDGATLKLFLGGLLDTSKAVIDSLPQNTIPVKIGSNSFQSADYFKGIIDEVRVSNIARPFGSGLVAYYPFNGNATDLSGNGNDGSILGGITPTTDRFGTPNSAYSFDGINDYILVNNSTSFPSNAITIAYWINRTGINLATLENYISKERAFQSYIYNTDRKFWSGFYRGASGWYNFNSGSYSVPVGSSNWIFYSMTYDNVSRTARTYINGSLVNSETSADPTVIVRTSSFPMYIGRNGTASVYYIKGKLDDLRLYNRVLSLAEIRALYFEPSTTIHLWASTSSTTSVALNWQTLSGSYSQYQLWGRRGTTGSDVLIATTTSTSYTHAGLIANTIYEYFVKGRTTTGNWIPSNRIQVQTLPAPLGVPSNLSASQITSSGFSLSWSSVPGATSYYVAWRRASETNLSNSPPVPTPLYQLTGLAPSTLYVVKVKAYSNNTIGPYSDSIIVSSLASNLSLAMLDANYEFLHETLPASNPCVLGSILGNPPTNMIREGTCADGVSKLIVSIILNNAPTQVTISVQNFGSPFDTLMCGTISTANTISFLKSLTLMPTDFCDLGNGRYLGSVVYTPPPDFVRGNSPSDTGRAERIVVFRSNMFSEVDSCLIKVRRVPIVLAHGFTSNPSAWNEFTAFSDQTVWRDWVFPFDYQASNAGSFETNSNKLVAFVTNSVLSIIRSRGIASSQVDYIGHSMGGNVGRYFWRNNGAQGRYTFGAGYFHKLITIGTPSFGTLYANYLQYGTVSPSVPGDLAARMFAYGRKIRPLVFLYLFGSNYLQLPLALRDMSVGSTALASIGETNVRSHSIVGRYNNNGPVGGEMELAIDLLRYGTTYTRSETAGYILGEANDILVSVTSQKGGISDLAKSEFNDVSHRYLIRGDSRVDTKTKELVDLPFASSSFGFFPAPPAQVPQVAFRDGRESPHILVPAVMDTFRVNISNLPDTLFVQAGTSVLVNIQVEDTTKLRLVIVGGVDQFEVDSTRRLSYAVPIPYSFAGTNEIFVIAADTAGNIGFDSVIVIVQPNGIVTNVDLSPDSLIIGLSTRDYPLELMAVYSDGANRDITYLSGVSFVSADTSIVAVTATGLINPLRPGHATVDATYLGFIDSIQIRIDTTIFTGVRDIELPAIPQTFQLAQNYPNPFNPVTTIRYEIPVQSRVILKIYNILGQEVTTLVNEEQRSGYKLVVWNANNFASGVYFYRLQADDFVQTKKLLLMK